MDSVPWHLVAEYLTLAEALVARRVCLVLAEGIHELSPNACARFLLSELIKRRCHVLPFGSWYQDARDVDSLTSFMTPAESDAHHHHGSAAFDRLLRCFRVIQHIPMEVAVAYSAKLGRHCLPLELDEVRDTVQIKRYKSCRRKHCTTCQFRIPLKDEVQAHGEIPNATDRERGSEETWDEETYLWKDINEHLEIQGKNGPVDISRFYNKCVPNLPADLICPCCQSLSEISYKSSPGCGRVPQLTFTPDLEEYRDDCCVVAESGVDNHEKSDPRAAKRLKLKRNQDFAVPPMFDDMAIPVDCVTRRPHSKHAIAIHCVQCKKFGMLSPAEPCNDDVVCCAKRAERLGKIVIGGVFLRRGCHYQRDCNWALMCTACRRSFPSLPVLVESSVIIL